MSKKSIKINPDEVIIVAGNYRSPESDKKIGDCVLCQASGWLNYGYGYPYSAKGAPDNSLVHKEKCPMNQLLKKDGQLKGKP